MRWLSILLSCLGLGVQAAPAPSIVTTSSGFTGLWWNPAESGWGLSLTEHGSVIFAAWYTYDAAGKPTWYAITNCPIVGAACEGDLVRASGGQPLSKPWKGTAKLASAGRAKITFSDGDHARLDFTLDGVSGSKAITRDVFATGAQVGAVNRSDLYWNRFESGWGMAMSHLAGTSFVTIFTYDDAGNPTWYAVSNCPMSFIGCTGDLFTAQGGVAPTADWKGAHVTVQGVGTATLSFANVSTLEATLGASTWNRTIEPDAFPGPGAPEVEYPSVNTAWAALPAGKFLARGFSIGGGFFSAEYYCDSQDNLPPLSYLADNLINLAANEAAKVCGSTSLESTCFYKTGNVLVRDIHGSPWKMDIVMPGLIDGYATQVWLDSSKYFMVNLVARRSDASLDATACAYDSNRAYPRTAAIEGNWLGYRYRHNLATGLGTTDAASMTCTNQVCTIVGEMTVTVDLSAGYLHNQYGASPLDAGATLTDDERLASVYVCPHATNRADDQLGLCSFYTFKRYP